MTIAYGVTEEGFVLKDLDTLKSELQADFRGEFGANLELDEREPAGQLVGILADHYSALWEVAEDVYLSFSPDDATGISLDNVSAITGTARPDARYSTVIATAHGTAGTVLLAGRVFKTEDTGARFATLADATIGGGGTIDVDCQAIESGPTLALADTLTVIETPVAGLTSVTNAEDAVPGAVQQEDPELRITREAELQGSGKAALPAIRAALLKVDGVFAVTGFENDTAATNGDGMPPWSVEALVSGGTDADVAASIFATKAAGITTTGTTTVVVVDDDGNNHSIKFTRPSDVLIYVIANLDVDATKYPVDGDAQVEEALDNWNNYLVSGRDVVAAALSAQAFTIPGVLDCEVLISTSPTPTLSTTISVGPRQQGKLDSGRTSVNSTPVTP
jgi:uncharacterized phage protein gp47/JayE